MAIAAGLQGIKDALAIDELAEHGLVSVEVASRAESDRELRAAGVLTIVGNGELTALVVPHRHVFVLKANAERSNVVLTHAAARDAEAGLAVVESGAGEGLALGAVAEGSEALRRLRLLLRVELEDEVADLLVTLGHGEVDALVRSVAVVVEGREAAPLDVEELPSLHFFLQLK